MPDKIGGDHMASLVVVPDLVEFLIIPRFRAEDSINVEQIFEKCAQTERTGHTGFGCSQKRVVP